MSTNKKFTLLFLFIVSCVYCWVWGYAVGEHFGENKYEWTNEDLRTDITNCRTTLNQCKKDLEDPHRCITVCMDEFQKYGC